ncbi:MAG: DUF1295 domain-containing protein [Eubacteriales bacterium]|nr:DUF1295 domain-containing protein [Eubacteriales bacterium]
MNDTWIILLALLVFFMITFIIAQSQKNNGLIDIAWGLGFVFSAWFSFWFGKPQGTVPLVMTLLVTVWGLRLTYYLMRRNLGKPEDFRYANMRATWNPSTFYLRMFIQIYLLQLVLNFLINWTTITANLQDLAGWSPLASVGVAVWLVGFFFESVGDWQLKHFKAEPQNKGQLIETGLWRYSRHPNYFGEAVQWWGIYLLAISGGRNFWLVVSPLLITVFLLYISGVPMLEKKYAGRPDWEDYKRRTSKFFPWFPKA